MVWRINGRGYYTPLTEETKRKIGEGIRRCYKEGRQKIRISSGMKGKHHSEKTKQKIREKNKNKTWSEEHRKNYYNSIERRKLKWVIYQLSKSIVWIIHS